MHYRILAVAILTSTIVASGVRADDAPVRQTVRGELEGQPEYFLDSKTGKPATRWKIDSVVATMPAKISAAVNDWTGIDDHGKWTLVKFLPISHDEFSASSYGDTSSTIVSVTPPGEAASVKVDAHVRYKEALLASDTKTFFVLSVHEFENRVTGRKCYVVCKIEGEIPKPKESEAPIIQPTGTATWVGPIIDASTPLFSDAAADEKLK